MMTESYAETIRGNAKSPYEYPVLTAELVLSHFESSAAHEAGTVISNLPSNGKPYYGRQKSVSSARVSYLLLPASPVMASP